MKTKYPDGLGGGVVACGHQRWNKRRVARAIRRNVRRWLHWVRLELDVAT